MPDKGKSKEVFVDRGLAKIKRNMEEWIEWETSGGDVVSQKVVGEIKNQKPSKESI